MRFKEHSLSKEFWKRWGSAEVFSRNPSQTSVVKYGSSQVGDLEPQALL